MKIATWNVNSLRVRLPHLLDWLKAAEPDVVGIQETKCQDEQFPFAALAAAGYQAVHNGQKTYNGVALLARAPLEEVSRDIPGLADEQKRVIAATVGVLFVVIPTQLLALFGMRDPAVVQIGIQLLAFLSVSGLFITTALTYTGGLQGTGDTKSPLYISLISQFAVPIGYMSIVQATRPLVPSDVWLAIVMGHALRCLLSVWRFRQGKWREIGLGV